MFSRKLYSLIGDSYNIFYTWNTNKIRFLFSLNLHQNCVVFERTCSCGVTERCEHLGIENSEPAKRLMENRNHSFTWKMISNASSEHTKFRKMISNASNEHTEFRKMISNASSEHMKFRKMISNASSEHTKFRKMISNASREHTNFRKMISNAYREHTKFRK